MKVRFDARTVTLLAVIGIIALLAFQCKKNTVLGVSDDTEIAGYIQHMAPAQDVFRADRIAINGTWSIPGTGVVFRDSVLSRTRNIQVFRSPAKYFYAELDSLYEAIAVITDQWLVREVRTAPDSPSVSTDIPVELVRYGFFLKLGTDGEDYLGWSLYGYGQAPGASGVPVTALSGTATAGSPIDVLPQDTMVLRPLNIKYVRLVDLRTVSKGARLKLDATALYPPLVGGANDSGLYSNLMTRVDSTHATDTVDVLGTGSIRAYDYILLHFVTPTKGLQSARMVLLPFRFQ